MIAVRRDVGARRFAVHTGLPAGQRSLFSWAEFLTERPEEPKRGRRNEAPTLSLFKWALDREREGELAPVGA